MNQQFSVVRFNRLLGKYFTDHRGQLLAYTGLLVGCLVVLCAFVYSSFPGNVNDLRLPLYFLLGWVCWYVFTVQQTAVLNQKEQAINYLMQPASQLEKIVLIWTVSGLGFILLYHALFSLFDLAGVWFVNHRHWSLDQLKMIHWRNSPLTIVSFFDDDSFRRIPAQFWVFTALIHPFAMTFSLLIRRYTLPLVVVAAFALFTFGILSNNVLLHSLTGTEAFRSVLPFSGGIMESPFNQFDYRTVDLPQPLGNQLRYLVGITVLLLLYITAYVRLKEREV